MSTSPPLVTISIPTYNQENYIGRAIESALAQSYPHIEIVVSDDLSTDGTLDVARRYAGDRVRVEASDRNVGRVANYRRCLYELARGEWVVNLDGDDFYEDPDFISNALQKIGGDPKVVMYAAGAKALLEDTGRIEQAPMVMAADECRMRGVDYVLSYPRLNAFQHFAVLYNRRRAMETGFYLLDSLGTDTDSLCRLALTGDVHVERRYVGVWTSHGQNASYSLTDADLGKEIGMLEHIGSALAEHVGPKCAARWTRERVKEKRRFAVNLQLSRMPIGRAWTFLLRRLRPDIFSLKETAKLVLRSAGLR
jgi:glycosyltransferase involved in cell wall biosynthesis